MMNKYESVIIINPNLENEALATLVKKFSDLIDTDGKVSSIEELGKKRLAYEIKKHKEAHYVLVNFEANPELITELERIFRITDDVIKYIVIRLEDEKAKTKTEIVETVETVEA